MPHTIINDGNIEIAIGKWRKETNWKATDMLWSELVARLGTTVRTAETYDNYLRMPVDKQMEVKDVGGFVGGTLSSGRRNKSSVISRCLVTLDADYAKPGFWDDFTMLYGNAAVVYSTHKHSAEKPRLRLIIPLDRPVFPDEYEAISRKIAGTLGIEVFDHTTYEPSRLMYWPSTAKDGEYVFEHQDGEWLCADDVLAEYKDWRNTLDWPTSLREDKRVTREITKQGDPLEKPGVVGAWCRTYSISEAIAAFLSDVYTECDVEGRYTYAAGSTSGGLVTYEDKYAYSHHGTDPTSGKLCNAFDLVRLHKFGLKDEDARADTPGNKLPSYTAMVEFAAKDKRVSKLITVESLQGAQNDFRDIADEVAEAVAEMDIDFSVDKKGNLHPSLENVVLILEHDPKLKGGVVFDEFEQREVVRKVLPWRNSKNNNKYFTDADIPNFKHYLKTVWSIQVSTPVIEDALSVVYERNRVNSVAEYLGGCKWDGTERVERLLVEYLGAEDTEYVRTVTRKALVAAVARAMKPGIKFDNVLVLVGKQGVGKSTLLNKLGGRWFSDSFNFHMLKNSKEAPEQIQGSWLIEIGEMYGLSKADAEAAKSFISRQEDRFRVSYGRRVEFFPRRCVFFGTTNVEAFMRDATGGRRYWPVKTGMQRITKSIFDDLTREEVMQIWGEALHYFNAGESLHLPKEIEIMAEMVQKDHSEYDERRGIIERYLNTKVPATWGELSIQERRLFLSDELAPAGEVERDLVCAAEIWCEVFGKAIGDMSSQNTKFIHDVMVTLPTWSRSKSKRAFSIYGKQNAYEKVKNVEPQ